jgi:hypothetical protein
MDQVALRYRLTAWHRHDDAARVYVSWCRSLGIFSQGETLEQAQSSIESACLLFLRRCHKLGILERELRLRGAELRARKLTDDGGDINHNHDGDFVAFSRIADASHHDFNVDLDFAIAPSAQGGRDSSEPICQ